MILLINKGKKLLGYVRTFRFNSIFIKTLLILFFLLILLMSIFFFFANKLTSENLREKTYASNLNMLNNTSNTTDNTLNSLAQSMRQTLQNQYLISAMIVPDLDNYDRTVSIVNQLNNAKKSSSLIKDALLYIPTDNTLYTAYGTTISADNFYDSKIIDAYKLNMYPGDFINSDSNRMEIKKIDGRIVLYQEFFPPHLKKIGTLIYEVDADNFYKIVNGNMNFLENNIYVFDKDSTPILPDQIDYSQLNMNKGAILDFTDKAGSISLNGLYNGHNIYFYYQSDLTGWKYIYPVKSESFHFNYNTTFSVALPFLAVYFIIGFLMSLMITFRIYKPINDLMLSISQSGSTALKIDGKTSKNELDFFFHAYYDAVEKNDQLNAAIDSISPAVMERLLTNLIYGRDIDVESVEGTLASIGNPFRIDARYTVISASIIHPDKKIIPEVEMQLYIIGINNMIKSQLDDSVKYYMLRTGDSTITLILGFSHDVSLMLIKQMTISLCSNIKGKVHSMPYNIVFGRGNIYNNLSDIKYSFTEAQEDMSYQLYLGNTNANDINLDLSKEDLYFSKHYFNEKITEIIKRISEGSCEHAVRLVKSIIAEISDSELDKSNIGHIFVTLVDCMAEKMIEYKIKGNEQIFERRKEMVRFIDTFESKSQMEQFTQRICKEAIELIDMSNRKSQHRYIVSAREYLNNNYSNRNLSLNMVAEFIGIKPTYLSRLFNENLNIGFVDYLHELRVKKAKKLLEETDLTIENIGYKAGFNSVQNFSRVFKKYEDISPGKYRPKNRK